MGTGRRILRGLFAGSRRADRRGHGCGIGPAIHEDTVPTALNPRYTFAQFVIGRSNETAAAVAAAVAAAPGRTYNPLFLYGDTGLGKTHLMHAVAHAALEQRPHARTAYVAAEQFTAELVQAIHGGTLSTFRDQYHRVDMLLVDDVHTLAGRREAQEAFAQAFSALYDAGRQVVVTSDRPPEAIGVADQLAGRFRLGKVADISLPDAEHRAAILRAKVRDEDLAGTVGEDVIALVADAVRSNVRAMEGALVRLLAYSRLRDRPVSLALAREALRIDPRGPAAFRRGAARVQDLVAAEWRVTPEALVSKRRSHDLLEPRQVAMYLCRELLDMTLDAVGGAFGGRDHSTVVNALDRLAQAMRVNPALVERIDRVRRGVRQRETPPSMPAITDGGPPFGG
jgi:chromosomal replication initiator protein